MERKGPFTPATATALTVAMFVFYRALERLGADEVALWMTRIALAFCVWELLRGLVATFRWSRLLRLMVTPTGLHGRTTHPSDDSPEDSGLKFSNADGNGIPLGGVGGRIAYYDGPGHLSIRAPTNGGKTESSAAPICFALGPHRNIVATAKGAELAFLTGEYRKNVLKQNVVYIDPWRQMKRLGLPSADFNPIGHFPAYVATDSPELIDKAFASSLILIPEAASASGENKVFRTTARELMGWVKVQLATDEYETGELCCNLPYLKRVLGGSDDDLKGFLQRMRGNDRFAGSVRRAAERFLSVVERSPRFAESVLSEALAALSLYDPAGALGSTTVYSDFDPRDLKTPGKPTSVYIVVEPSKATLYGPHVGLCLNALLDVCVEANSFEPRVTVVADEFASCGVLPSALPTLYIGRSRGVQLVTYVQDTKSYARYGQEASAFTTQAECVLAWGVRDVKDAEEYSKRAGQWSVMTEGTSVPSDRSGATGYSVSLNEKGVPVYRADEFLHLPDFTAALFYKQNPPMIVDLVSYRSVDGWRQHAKPMPGSPPLKDIPVKYRA